MRLGHLLVGSCVGIIFALKPMPTLAAQDSDESASEGDSKGERATSDEPKERTEAEEKSSKAPSEKPAKEPNEQERAHLHAGQFSLRMAFVGAYRIVSRYDTSPYCENPVPAAAADRKKFCGFGAPPAIDLAIGFAPLNSIEPFAFARFGLVGESETDTKPQVTLGVGARLYTSNESAFKFFIQPAVGWELEKGQGHANWRDTQYKQDLLLQLLAGPQYDFTKGFGAYAAAGVTAGIFRAIQTWMEFDIGVQARY